MAVVVIAALFAACGGDDGGDEGAASTAAPSESVTTVAASEKHMCDLFTRDEVQTITGLTFDQTEREDRFPNSCTYRNGPKTGGTPEAASVFLGVVHASDGTPLQHTGSGSFLSGTKDKPIPGIAGATDTGVYYGESAARFGDDRIVRVRVDVSGAIDSRGFDRSAKSVELLKALIAKGV